MIATTLLPNGDVLVTFMIDDDRQIVRRRRLQRLGSSRDPFVEELDGRRYVTVSLPADTVTCFRYLATAASSSMTRRPIASSPTATARPTACSTNRCAVDVAGNGPERRPRPTVNKPPTPDSGTATPRRAGGSVCHSAEGRSPRLASKPASRRARLRSKRPAPRAWAWICDHSGSRPSSATISASAG